jgi:hypothetical protein
MRSSSNNVINKSNIVFFFFFVRRLHHDESLQFFKQWIFTRALEFEIVGIRFRPKRNRILRLLIDAVLHAHFFSMKKEESEVWISKKTHTVFPLISTHSPCANLIASSLLENLIVTCCKASAVPVQPINGDSQYACSLSKLMYH